MSKDNNKEKSKMPAVLDALFGGKQKNSQSTEYSRGASPVINSISGSRRNKRRSDKKQPPLNSVASTKSKTANRQSLGDGDSVSSDKKATTPSKSFASEPSKTTNRWSGSDSDSDRTQNTAPRKPVRSSDTEVTRQETASASVTKAANERKKSPTRSTSPENRGAGMQR